MIRTYDEAYELGLKIQEEMKNRNIDCSRYHSRKKIHIRDKKGYREVSQPIILLKIEIPYDKW